MCGFIGILSNKENARALFEQGVDAIQPRGITTDIYEHDAERYGYCRLPTDDVNNDTLSSITDKPAKLLFNGLITNVGYLQHAFRLPARTAHSDQRCLRIGLEQHGPAFLRHCRGMFALAFVTDEHILLARDTVGIKPLYYVQGDDTFAFASELKALRNIGLPVHEVLPGQLVQYNKATQRLTKQHFAYELAESLELEQLLVRAVVEPTERYLANSTKPVAVLLSGGLDSSVTTKLLVKHLPKKYMRRLQAFCIGEPDAPDVLIAEKLAAELGLHLTRLKPYTAEQSLQKLPQIVYDTESPHARVTKVALLYDRLAAEITRRGVDVVIGGEGADELFYGYQRFIDGLTHQHSHELFNLFYRDVFPATLLQRYDRIFARHQIEGRVPYLDQAIVAYAQSLPAGQKVCYVTDGHVSKLPLRALAKQLGLPAYIYNRGKEKMTAGATGKQNETGAQGYLEQEAIFATGTTFQEFVTVLYQLYFGNVAAPVNRKSEEELMQLAATMKQTKERNMTHER